MQVSSADSLDRPRPDPEELLRRVQAARQVAVSLAGELERAHAASDAARRRLSRNELLRVSETLRLRARLTTLPMIEQAKGVIMEQSGCSAVEAFDMMRRASQRSNIPVRELAEQIVAHAMESARATAG